MKTLAIVLIRDISFHSGGQDGCRGRAERPSHHAPPHHGQYQEGLTPEAGDKKRSRRDLFSASLFCPFQCLWCVGPGRKADLLSAPFSAPVQSQTREDQQLHLALPPPTPSLSITPELRVSTGQGDFWFVPLKAVWKSFLRALRHCLSFPPCRPAPLVPASDTPWSSVSGHSG